MKTRLLALGVVLAPLVAVVVAVYGFTDSAPIPRADLRNGRIAIQDNLWSTDEEQFAVWVAPNGTPFAGQRDRSGGSWEVAHLGRVTDNPLGAPVTDDEHHFFVIGVDSLGHVHVAGNMHSEPLRYVRSHAPGDITGWDVGPAPLPGDQVTYPRFVALPDGTLLFWRREGVAGEGSIVLDALDPGATEWRHVGTVLDGGPSGESPYLHQVAVDPGSGALHLMFEWRGDAGVATTNDVGYARSDDGGRSWHTSDGSALPVPITHERSETVLDTRSSGSGLINTGGLTVDRQGRPHGVVTFNQPTGERMLVHLWHDGNRWRREQWPGSLVDGRAAIAATPDGGLWLLGARGTELTAVNVTAGETATSRVGRVPRRWEATFDSQALASNGEVEILVPDGRTPRVLTAARKRAA